MLEKYAAESAIFTIDCSQLLAAAETITGTPTMAFLPALTGPDALTIAAPVVNTQAVTMPDGRTVAAGKAIQVRISGGTPSTDTQARTYAVTATFNTSTSQTLVAKSLLQVLPISPNY